MSRARLLSPWRALAAATAVALLTAWVATGTTRSDWTVSTLANDTDTARTGSLAFTHTYGSTSCSAGPRVAGTQSCSGSLLPATAVGAAGSVAGSDTIANNGNLASSQLSASVRAASCGPVQLANAKGSNANPMLPRYATGFQADGPMTGSNAISFDGSSGYAASVTQQSIPAPALSLSVAYGWGVWFKTTSTTGGPLFGFTDSPDNSTPTNTDHILYLDGSGKIGFGYTKAASTPKSTTGAYNDGSWHFAYARLNVTGLVVLGTVSVTVYVDGVQATRATGVDLSGSGGLASFNGYWHLGWSPLSARTYGIGLSNYFAGSLSNFVVFHNSPAPSVPSNPMTQASFDAFTASATEHWKLDDSGTTTFGDTVPGTSASPCTMIDVTWSFASPAGTPVSGISLGTFANNSPRSVVAPDAGGSQSSTLTVSRGTSYDPDVAGLRLYLPLSWTVDPVPTGSPWSLVFAWTSAAAVVVA